MSLGARNWQLMTGTRFCPREVPVAAVREGFLPQWDCLPLHHFLFVRFPNKTKRVTKSPFSVLQEQRDGETLPSLPAPPGFSADLPHPWDTEDLQPVP